MADFVRLSDKWVRRVVSARTQRVKGCEVYRWREIKSKDRSEILKVVGTRLGNKNFGTYYFAVEITEERQQVVVASSNCLFSFPHRIRTL